MKKENSLTKKLYCALNEVMQIKYNKRKSVKAREFLAELKDKE